MSKHLSLHWLYIVFLCLNLSFISPYSYAFDEDDDDAMEMLLSLNLAELQNVKVSVASGFEQSLKEAPSTVTVITQAQWQVMGATTLDEVLETIPGIHVTLSQTALTSPVYSIRGLQSNLNSQVMVLIDGDHIHSLNGGSTLFGFRKSLTAYKQIEVIRGPGSAIYGANSFSGVINLVTKKATDDNSKTFSSSAGLRVGSFNSMYGWLDHQGHFAELDYRLTVDLHSSDDDSDRMVSSDLQTVFDGIFGTSASQAPGSIDNSYNIQDITLSVDGDGWNASLWHYRNNQAGLGAGAAQAIDPSGHFTNGITLGKVGYDLSHWITGSANLDFSIQRKIYDSIYHIFPAGAVLPIGSDGNLDFIAPTTVTLFTEGFLGNPQTDAKTYNLSFTHLFNLNAQNKFRWQIGINYLDYDAAETKNFGPTILDGTELVVDGTLTNVDDTEALYTEDVQEHFLFVSIQDEWQISENVSAVIGLRYDDYESFGSTVNPRLSVIWHANEKMTTKFQYGSAFRAPSSNERFFRNNPVTLGNENLQPEEIDTLEFSIDYQWHENLITNLTWYQYKATNLIEFVFEPNFSGNVAQNVGQQDGDGIEAAIKWKIGELNFEFNYAHINAVDGLGDKVANIPQNQYFAAVNWHFTEHWQLHARINRVTDRLRPTSDPRSPIADYNSVNIKIQRSNIIPGLNFALIANNALDDDLREPSNGVIAEDYPLAGRQVLAELSYQF